MRSKSEIFTDLCNRNSLRKAGGVPLLDIRVEMERELRKEKEIERQRLKVQYADQFRAIRDQVLVELRKTRGAEYGESIGALWVIQALARSRFEVFLDQIAPETVMK